MEKIIRGWKGICEALGYRERTIRRWHYEIAPIPFNKKSHAQQGRVEIEEGLLKAWYKDIISLRKELKKDYAIKPYGTNLLNYKSLSPLHSDN